tara:strand:+ start:4022 stop:4948 length:927 start_codon:yes stop_codon:yes gene_type:complete
MRFSPVPLIVAVACLAGGAAVSMSSLRIDSDLGSEWDQRNPTPVVQSDQPSSLARSVREDIETEALMAMRILKDKERRNVVLESSSFSRGGGAVRGQGVFWDGAGPREIRMYLDAYGDGRLPIASFPFDFVSTGQKQPLSVSARDYPAFKRFAFRFSHEGVTLDLQAQQEGDLAVSSVSPSAMLFHSDYGELAGLLEAAGFRSSASIEPEAMLGAVRRFRAENGISGPDFVSVGDLFALRRVTKVQGGPTSLIPYVEWSTASGGAREKHQEEYSEPVAEDESTKREPDPEEIYADMDPPAEQDRDYPR